MRGHPSRYSGADAMAVRRFARRLAILMVGLLCALLLALVVVIYLRTQSALFASLHDQLELRARSEQYHLTSLARYSSGGEMVRESAREEQERGSIFIAFVNRAGRFVGGSGGPLGAQIPDLRAATVALRTGRSSYATRQTPGGQQYLIYSLPVRYRQQIVGVVQTGASERSYLDSLAALLQSLVLVCVLGVLAAGGITWLVVHRALQPIRDAVRRQRDFVADAAHELRAPLAILRTAAELGIAPGSEEDQQEAMEQVLIQGNHLARLVDDLALLARADSGAVSVERERLDLTELAADMVEGMHLLAEEQGVSLHCRSFGPVWMLGDPGRLHQLLLILLDNALKHTPAGGSITVQVSQHGHHAQVQVQDTGEGIDPAHLPYLFERFYRVDPARSREGTGLGLAIAHWIVTAHDGHIRAASVPHQGATFTVTLPADAA
jgi:signal transduction histidine kinase